MEDEKESQIPAEGTSDNSQDGNALDKLLDTAEKPEEEKETKAPEEKERDFEKGMYKYKDLYKSEKAKRLELESKPVETPIEKKEDIDLNELENDPGVKVLKSIIDKSLEPYVKTLREQEEDRILSDFEKKNWVNELGPQIQEELKTLPDSMPLGQRLEQARLHAIAKNLDLITKASYEVGKESGYKSKTFKQSQGGLKENPNQSSGKDDFLERLDTGNVSDEEFRERHDEVEAYYQQQIK